MTRDVKAAGGLRQFAHAALVDGAFGGEAAEHHAGHAEVAQGGYVGQHRTVLGFAVEKIAATRPHHGMERHNRLVERGAHGSQARRDAAFDEAGAQFDPVGAAGLCGQKAINALDTDFDQRRAGFFSQGVILSMML